MENYLNMVQGENPNHPPKPILEGDSGINNLAKSLVSILLYLIVGYALIKNLSVIILLISLLLIHELGHLLAMKKFQYNDTKLLFIPIFGALVSGKKREVSQIESAIIYLAGPIPGILIGVLMILFHQSQPDIKILGFSVKLIGELFIWMNAINLLPIPPLDGGQLLNRVYFNEDDRIRKIFAIFSILFLCFIVFYFKVYILLIIPAFIIYNLVRTTKIKALDKDLEASGINLDKDYDDLTDDEYWTLRQIIIKHFPQHSYSSKTFPLVYDYKETKLAQEVANVLQRNLIEDADIKSKIIIAIIWISALLTPLCINSSIVLDFLKRMF